MADKKRALGKGFGALVDSTRARPRPEKRAAESTFNVSVERIAPNPYQPRQQFDEVGLAALATSIKRDGVLQPLAVRPPTEEGGPYGLIAGERRLRAAKMAGLREVPCVVIETDEEGLGLLSLVENLLREDLNVLDEAEAYQQLIDEFGMTQEQISERVGRSRPHVANTLRLLHLPELVRVYLTSGELSPGHGRALLAVGNSDDIIVLAQEVLARQLSVRETEAMVKNAAAVLRHLRGGQAASKAPKGKTHPYAHLEDSLRVRFGTKVQLAGGKQKGKIELHYFSEEELTRLIDLLLH